jgi:hypothetical protein
MSEGIKESKEALLGILKVAEVLGPILKDGFQAGADLAAIFAQFSANQELKDKVAAAMDASNKIPAELKDITFAESIDMLIVVAPELPKVLAAWKK